jgi:hypothetical protein
MVDLRRGRSLMAGIRSSPAVPVNRQLALGQTSRL